MSHTQKVLSAAQIHSIYEQGLPKGGYDPNAPQPQYRRVSSSSEESLHPKGAPFATPGAFGKTR